MARQHCLTRLTCEICLIIAVILNFVVVSHSQACSRTVVQPDGSTTCYSLVFAGDTWSVARRQCASRGASSRLALVSSAEQNDAITALLQDNGLSESWLAARETEHAWQWLDGSEVSYQGCYKDDEQSRDLDHRILLSGTNSPQRCLTECTALSYSYAGLQNGDECWCGNTFGRHGQRNAICAVTCPGQNTTFCGGNHASDIYAVAGRPTYSYWSRFEPYNPTGNTNCAVLETTEDEVHWMDYACSRSDIGALCDLGPGTASECDGRSSSFIVTDRCVDVITDVATYFKARAMCRRRGPVADLVQLKTEADNAQAAAALRNYLNSTETEAPNRFWIGLVRSRWSWESGMEMTFTNWDQNTPTSPTTAGQQCAILSRDINGRWKNVACNLTKPFVCEDVNSVPVKSTTTTLPTTTKTTTKSDGNISPRSLSSTSSHSAGSTTTSLWSTPTAVTGASNTVLSTELLIGIVCGGFAILVAVIIVAVVVPVVLCRRKHGKSACCCCTSDPEVRATNEDALKRTESKPRYYFGVTTEDLRQAGETPSVDNDVSVTTPPPDVVPAMQLN